MAPAHVVKRMSVKNYDVISLPTHCRRYYYTFHALRSIVFNTNFFTDYLQRKRHIFRLGFLCLHAPIPVLCHTIEVESGFRKPCVRI